MRRRKYLLARFPLVFVERVEAHSQLCHHARPASALLMAHHCIVPLVGFPFVSP